MNGSSLRPHEQVIEKRQSQRKRITDLIPVTNIITGVVIGHLRNLSASGLMLVTPRLFSGNPLFHLVFTLPNKQGNTPLIELHAEIQWCGKTELLDHYWIGLRIIDISNDNFHRLADWIHRAQ